MKYILLFFLIILIGCASTSDNIKTLESSSVNFDVSAGKYEKYKLNSWKFDSYQCVEFALKKPYNSTNWLANVLLYVEGGSQKEISKIMLYTEQRDSKSLTLAYIGSDKEYRIIQKNINFGEAVKFNVIFTKNRTVGVKLLYSEFNFPLQFKVNTVVIGAASSQATVEILETSECKNQ